MNLTKLREERAAMFASRKRSDNTRRNYACDWSSFGTWCERAGRLALPATSDTVQLYLMGLAQLGRLPATMARHASAIAERHVSSGEKSPIDADVREVLGGLRRELGSAARHAKAALSVADLRVMLRATPADARGARDRALLLVGFASGLRRSELVSLDLGDVRFEQRGAVIALGKSKTDQEGAGQFIGVHKGKRRETCPVLALRAWLVERGPWPGALFCSVDANGALRHHAMSDQSVAACVKVAAARAGLNAARFGAHSMRAGLVTAAGGAGVGVLAIMARTGHRDQKTVQRYMRPASALAVDPLAGLL